MTKRKVGQQHKGWKSAAKKYKVNGVWRTGIPQRMRRKPRCECGDQNCPSWEPKKINPG